MHQVKHCRLPPNIIDLFHPYSAPTRTRSHNDFKLPKARLNIRQMCISYAGVSLWNSLNPTIRTCIALSRFKNLVKEYLFSK